MAGIFLCPILNGKLQLHICQVNSAIRKYLSIPRVIIHLMLADVFLQLINSAFTMLLNYQMLDHGFKDFQIASMIGNRYLTVLLCAVPLALIAKGKKLKPFIQPHLLAKIYKIIGVILLVFASRLLWFAFFYK